MKRDEASTRSPFEQSLTLIRGKPSATGKLLFSSKTATNYSTVNQSVSFHNASTGTAGPELTNFYSSYQPEIGIHTATVLGGILCLLMIYLIYRTKCRKRLMGAFNKCLESLMPEEYNLDDSPVRKVSEKRFPKGRRKSGMEIQNSNLPEEVIIDKGNNAGNCVIKVTCPSSGENDIPCVSNEDIVNNDGRWITVPKLNPCEALPLKLPEAEENSEVATAQWVKRVQELDPKDRDISEIILKVTPDLLTNSTNHTRHKRHFLSVSDYEDRDGFVHISSTLNKSLPLLLESQRARTQQVLQPKRTETKPDKNYEIKKSTLNAKKPQVIEAYPQQLKVQHQSGAKVPLDICPIIKIQHYNSRSKRRLTSLCRSSSEESFSSNSSDDPLLLQVPVEPWLSQKRSKSSNDYFPVVDLGESLPFQKKNSQPNIPLKCQKYNHSRLSETKL